MPTLLLILATILWGGSFMLNKIAIQEVSPLTFIFYRSLLGALCVLPSLALLTSKPAREEIFRGAKLALFLGGIMFFQTKGLQTVTASAGAFLTGFSVVFVLMLRCISDKKLPSWGDIVATLICVVGLGLVTESHGVVLRIGTLYMLVCALSIALYIHAMSVYARNSRISVLTLVQLVVLAAFSGAATLLSEGSIVIPTQQATWGAILFCGVICSALCFWIQGYAQQYLSSFRASAINILEPVFASIFAYWFMGEELSLSFCLGAAMILGAIMFINWRLEAS